MKSAKFVPFCIFLMVHHIHNILPPPNHKCVKNFLQVKEEGGGSYLAGNFFIDYAEFHIF